MSTSFPVWACLIAWPILGEKPRGTGALALAFCIGGLAVLIWPVIGTAGATRLALSVLGAMMGRPAGTSYLKLARSKRSGGIPRFARRMHEIEHARLSSDARL